MLTRWFRKLRINRRRKVVTECLYREAAVFGHEPKMEDARSLELAIFGDSIVEWT